MMSWHTIGRFAVGLSLILSGTSALAQNSSQISKPQTPKDIYGSIGTPDAQQTPIQMTPTKTGLPVKVFYEWPNLTGKFSLTLTLFEHSSTADNSARKNLSQSTLFLENLGTETEAILTYPESINSLRLEGELRDQNQNLVLKTTYPLPVLSPDLRILTLTPPSNLDIGNVTKPDFTSVETITGNITLPPNSSLPAGSMLHVQLLENGLAGGLSMEMAAQDFRPAIAQNGTIKFSMRRGIWDRPNPPDLAFKAWITNPAGRKTFVMRNPVGYNGPDIKYSLALDGLRQGVATNRGKNLNVASMAQTLIRGEAAFDPVNGIPQQARLNIKLKQDRGNYNENPILTEQTLIISGNPTRIPFSLVADSIYFDPYVPAPILSVSLTDGFGRIYYTSGEIRAREGDNIIRLFPR
jgi:hypothetical protein